MYRLKRFLFLAIFILTIISLTPITGVVNNVYQQNSHNQEYLEYSNTLDLVYGTNAATFIASTYNDPAFDIYLEQLPSTLDYVVVSNGTYFYTTRYDGKVVFEGTNATSIIQQTLGSLTSGRTWFERVLCKGVFIINATIHIPQYTELEINGLIKLANNSQSDILSIDGDYVYIHGGILDGNKANCPNGGCGITTNAVHTYVAIDHITIRNTKDYGIIWLYNRSTLFFSRILNSDSYGVYTNASSYDCVMALNTVEDNALGSVEVDGTTHVMFVRNIGFPTEGYGVVTFNGDGSTTNFTWTHNLALTPREIDVAPLSADAAGAFYVTANSTHITVVYRGANPPDWTSSAPPSGTNNVVLAWHAVCIP